MQYANANLHVQLFLSNKFACAIFFENANLEGANNLHMQQLISCILHFAHAILQLHIALCTLP